MLQLIITATLLITGLVASEKNVNQTRAAKTAVYLEINGENKKSNFHNRENTHLLEKHTKMKDENERETI